MGKISKKREVEQGGGGAGARSKERNKKDQYEQMNESILESSSGRGPVEFKKE